MLHNYAKADALTCDLCDNDVDSFWKTVYKMIGLLDATLSKDIKC